MKASTFSILLLAVTAILPVSSHSSTGCREAVALNTNQQFSPVQLVQQDLINGIWIKQLPEGGKKTFFFYAGGKAEIIAETASYKAVFYRAEWQAGQANGEVLLTLKVSAQPKENRYRVQQNCEGILLTNLQTGEISSLTYQPPKEADKLKSIKNYLAGRWTKVSQLAAGTKNDALKTAFLHLDLRPDGAFICAYGTNVKQAEESGTWEVSVDGQFLMLHTGTGNRQQTKVAKIVSADEESLVLECLQGFGFCQFFGVEVGSLAFIK